MICEKGKLLTDYWCVFTTDFEQDAFKQERNFMPLVELCYSSLAMPVPSLYNRGGRC